MMEFNRKNLELSGFKGFIKISKCRQDKCKEIPNFRGVYIVYYEANKVPEFLAKSTGGKHKGEYPTVPMPTLQQKWVIDASVLYIGQAGGKGSNATLLSRLKQYLNSGDSNKTSGHWGGRYIWQLAESDDLVIAWRIEREKDPIDVENELINSFVSQYRRLPFANLR